MSIAKDMINGHSCCLCGIYFEKDHGYPVVCKDCYSDLTDEEREEYQRALHKEL